MRWGLVCFFALVFCVASPAYAGVKAGQSVDASTSAAIQLSYEHHEIHDGSHFYICGFITVADTVEVDFAVTTPDTTTELHMVFLIAGTSRLEFQIFETSTVTGGTPATPINNNRRSAETSAATIVIDPTVNVEGDEIFSQSSGKEGVGAKLANTGIVRRDGEFILKRNTTYIFRITSRDDGNIISYCGDWYEHTSKG